MKVEILKNMVVNGKSAKAGDKAEVSEKDGFYIVCRGFAKELKEEAPKAKAKAKK